MSAEAPGGLADAVTDAFVAGRLDLAARPDAPAPGWRGMTKVAAEPLAASAVVGFDRLWVVA
jgi:hypothetical protein